MSSAHDEAVAAYHAYREQQRAAGEPAPEKQSTPDPAAAHQAALDRASRLLTPAGRAAEAAERAAVADAERAAQPPPRDVLREAHRERDEAAGEVERLRVARDRATGHLRTVEAERDAAKQALDDAEAADASRLIEQLSEGGSPGRAEPAGGPLRLALAEAEHHVAIGLRAVEALTGELAQAEAQFAAAEAEVNAAICAVMLEVARKDAVAILRAADDLDNRRARLDALAMEISNRERRLGPGRRAWPGQIREALQPQLRGEPRLPSRFAGAAPEATRHWGDLAARLARDADAALDDDPEAAPESPPSASETETAISG